jgi:hypothetical protein
MLFELYGELCSGGTDCSHGRPMLADNRSYHIFMKSKDIPFFLLMKSEYENSIDPLFELIEGQL